MTVDNVCMCRGSNYGVDQVLLSVSEREQDINNGCLQSDSGQRHQWSELISDMERACSVLMSSVCFVVMHETLKQLHVSVCK